MDEEKVKKQVRMSMIIVNSIINNNTVAILPACISNVKFNLILLVIMVTNQECIMRKEKE